MQPWNIVFLIGFVIYVVIRGTFEHRSKGNEQLVSRSDRRELALLVIMALGSMILPLLYLFTSLLRFADYRRQFLVRPLEAEELQRQFGDAYLEYQNQIHCWRKTLKAYQQSRSNAVTERSA